SWLDAQLPTYGIRHGRGQPGVCLWAARNVGALGVSGRVGHQRWEYRDEWFDVSGVDRRCGDLAKVVMPEHRLRSGRLSGQHHQHWEGCLLELGLAVLGRK